MVRRNFKIGGIDTSNVNISANGFATTLTANATLASNVSFSLPGADGNSGQVLATDGGGNLFFADSSANTQAYVGDSLLSNTALILEAGDGVSVSGNTVSGVVSFSTSMSNVTSQVISVDGSANSFSLTKSVSNSHMVLVSYNGLLQDPTTYNVSGTTLTISNTKPLLADSTVEVRYFDFFSLPGATEGSGGSESSPTHAQGSNFGYVSGGYTGAASSDVIDKYSFTSDANSTDIGELTTTKQASSGHSSSTHGYVSLGYVTSYISSIEKFPFSSDSSAVLSAYASTSRGYAASQSSEYYGYSSGGYNSIYPPAGRRRNDITKFSFTSDVNGTLVGSITDRISSTTGHSSSTDGYQSGGSDGSELTTIKKFPFSSDTDSTDVGDLTQARSAASGQNSATHGYASGGQLSATRYTTIDKFPFSSDSNATDVGDLLDVRRGASGQSSTQSGYVSAGQEDNVIQKFPFSSDTNSTDVGDLTQGRDWSAGHQY